MKLVLNEKKILDRALNEGIIEDKPTVTIRVLAKHYFGIGYEREQVIFSVNNFMCKNYPGYIFSKWQKTIKNIVDRVNRKGDFELVYIDNVIIYKSEIDVIRSIGNLRLEKLAFVLLVYAKIYNKLNKNKTNWVNADLKDILNDTGMRISKVNGALMIYELNKLGLVQPSKIVDSTNIKVLFAQTDGDVVFIIDDFRSFIYYYLNLVEPGKHMRCQECGEIVGYYNTRKYCNPCAKKVNIKRTTERKKIRKV